MIEKILKIVCANLVFTTCCAVQIPEGKIATAEQLYVKLEPVKHDITLEQCEEIMSQIPDLQEYAREDNLGIRLKNDTIELKLIAAKNKISNYSIRIIDGFVKVISETFGNAYEGPKGKARAQKRKRAVLVSLSERPMTPTPPLSDESPSFSSGESPFEEANERPSE